VNIMLLAIFASAAVGVFAKSFDGRFAKLALVIPVLLTLAYLFHPRYMT